MKRFLIKFGLTSNNQLNNKKMKTKKSTLTFLFCGFILLATSCGSKNEPASQALPDPVQKEIIAQIFGAGASASGVSMVSPSKTMASQPVFKSPASAATSIPIPSSTTDGQNGGTLTLSGSMDISSNSADAGTISMTMNEVFAGFGILADTKTYTMSGTIQYTGNFIISTNKMTGKFTTNGSLTVVGDGYNKQMAINLTETTSVTVNSTTNTTSTSVTVTGTIAGQSINYTVNQ
jgi:hypothetical protein